MPKFGADTIDTMEYDFTKWVPGDPDAAGEIPEPTELQVQAYFSEVGDIALEEAHFFAERLKAHNDGRRARYLEAHPLEDPQPTDDELPADPPELIQAFNRDHEDEMRKFREAMRARTIAAIAELCSHKPSVTVLSALPFRQIDGFSGWLTGQFSPEARAAAIKR